MISDKSELLSEFSTAWKRESKVLAVSLEDARRDQARLRVERLGGIFGALMMLVTGLYFFWAGTLLHLISGVVLVVTAGFVYVNAEKTSRVLLHWEDWSPEGLLDYRLRSCRFSIHGFRGGIRASWFLLGFTGFIWLYDLSGIQQDMPAHFARLYAMITVPTALIMMVVFKASLVRKQQELGRLQAVMAEFQEQAT